MRYCKVSFSLAMITLALFWIASVSMAQQSTEIKTLTFAPKSEIKFAAPWQRSAMKYTNAEELVVMRAATPEEIAKEPEKAGSYAAARMLITTETRKDHADALQRLEAIAASREAPATFNEVGGWPAVEITFTENLPRRGARGDEEEEAESLGPDVSVQRTITAIAQGDKVVIFDTTVYYRKHRPTS